MSYIADPLDTSKPEDTDYIGLATPAEFRALKLRVNNAVATLNQAILDMGSTGDSKLADAVSDLNTAIAAVDKLIDDHMVADNPHGLTKSSVGLNNLGNYTATSALDDNSTTKYLLAKAAYDLKVALDALATSTGTTLTDHDTRITTAQSTASYAASSASSVAEDLNIYKTRDSQLITKQSLPAGILSIPNGSTYLTEGNSTQLRQGIYTVYGNIYSSVAPVGLRGKTVAVFTVTHDVLYAGNVPGFNAIGDTYKAIYGGGYHLGAIPALTLRINSIYDFEFAGRGDEGNASSNLRCEIVRIMFTPF